MANDENESDESKETDNENELIIIIKKFRRFMRSKIYIFENGSLIEGKESKEKEKEQMLKHFKVNYPLLQKGSKKH